MFLINRLQFGVVLIFLFVKFDHFYGAKSKTFKGLRIFNGQEANPSEFPYIVAIGFEVTGIKQIKYNMLCSGSIIAPVWTLTAAHCIPDIKKHLPVPVNNSNTQNKPVIRYFSASSWAFSNIIQAIMHPGYKKISFKSVNHDIGLLQTETMIVARLGKISAVHFATLYGHKVIAAGYGWTLSPKKDHTSLIRSLHTLEAIVVKCKNYGSFVNVRPSFCLASPCNKPSTTCGGDSGGPLLHMSGIIGVNTASINKYCDLNINKIVLNAAGWETPVSVYINWISKHIEKA